ncbi:MAG: glycosyltransferase family 1 protein [Burkholderiales bacterium]|nr:glycosyltransferase family 1 protein [Burkholderiales bacterium]
MTLRVLHAPGIAGGNAAELARAERAIGLDSHCVAFDPNPLGYEVDEVIDPQRGRLRFELARWRWAWRAWRDFDVVHFNFGQTFMPQQGPHARGVSWRERPLRAAYRAWARSAELRDLAFLKSRGKAVFMTYQGDDARQGDFCREHFKVTFADRVEPDYYAPGTDAAKRRRIARVDRYADGIFALNPDLLHVLPARAQFLPYANVDLKTLKPSPADNAVPVIVHAPSHGAVKGTDVVVAAMEEMRRRGLVFEFVLVTGRTRSEALDIYRRADLCVDQLFAGWYGGLAVEMMALGKPVATYLREGDLDFLPSEMRAALPVVQVRPDNVADVLAEFLSRPRMAWLELGMLSRAFAETWHDPVGIARRLMANYVAAAGGSRQGGA